jgi:dihydropyrimidinase
LYDLVISDGTLVCGGEVLRADLAVSAGKIVAIGSHLEGRETISAAGLLVLPGGVDPHVHIQMPTAVTVTSDTWPSGSRAAAFGGTTTVIDFVEPNYPGQPLLESYRERLAQAQAKSAVDFGFHMTLCAAEAATLDQVEGVVAAGMPSFKVYTTYPGFHLDDEALLAVFDAVKAAGGLVVVHAESDAIIRRATARLKKAERLSVADFPASRPGQAEKEAVARVLSLAAACGAPVYIVHVSTRAGAEVIAQARGGGQAAWGETCPQYLLLDEGYIRTADFTGAKYVCCPPLRTLSDQEGLWAALHSGDLQTIGTDHCAFNYAGQKDLGQDSFLNIPSGLPGIETRLRLLYTYGVKPGRLSLTEWVSLCSTTPARLFGLYPCKGTLIPGADADIVLFDPNASGRLTHAGLHEEVDYTPYEGFAVAGQVRTVLLRGRVLVRDGRWVGPADGGRFVAGGRFNPFSQAL